MAVHNSNGDLTLSMRTLAKEFGMGRDTVAKRLESAGLRPADEVKGFPVYRLRDACKAILGLTSGGNAGEEYAGDPFKGLASSRKKNEDLKFDLAVGNVVPKEVLQDQLAAMVKKNVQFLAAFPDRFERQQGLTTDQVEWVVDQCEAARASYFEMLSDDDA